ncbi:MAG: hypothetical protein VST70_01695 [Nitrospirota bacterium]|nr:hypothetical protein [Nitrospirota bacterium]
MFEIPLKSGNQTFLITLGTVAYSLTILWRDPLGYFLDIADSEGNPILQGLAMVTGSDLLGQYAYLAIGGSVGAGTLTVVSDGLDPLVDLTYDNLGTSSHLYWTPVV